MKRTLVLWILIGLSVVLIGACQKTNNESGAELSDTSTENVTESAGEGSTGEVEKIDSTLLASFKTLPAVMTSSKNDITDAKVDLGRKLYYDTRLSINQQISCNTCHDLKTFGVDNLPVSKGHKDQVGARNSPTVYNAAGNFVQFWDGRAEDVEEQAKGPILNPVEMAMPDEDYVVRTLKTIPGYVEDFQKAFPESKDSVTYDNMAKAIGAFERKLTTPSRWDEFLAGNDDALTIEEKKGFNQFVAGGCMTCHSGTYLGGNMYQKTGLVKKWPGIKDTGRAEVTKNDADKFFFKVPGLRNVEKTAPYMHDGSVAGLNDAISMMAEYQMGRNLSQEDSSQIATFLKSLTGRIPEDYIALPELPASGPDTPKPVAD